ncbi:MAG: CDP-alcohol phosphatidyltransferase family protein [Chloroflexi bacterium]|jgi:CDP-diacylglycerol--glycerol-3-phosphate 3-phosphatidyltransferase|nr:CDP-alcohol phosphatidyltransferase family protein [Chloroflexota bacterium]
MDPTPSTIPNDKETLTDILRRRTLFIIDPVVTVMARWRISPNSLTIAGMLAHFLVAWLIAQGEMQWAAVAIFFIAPLDALDGALARKLGLQQGNFGAFLDSTLDRLAEIILFGGFIFYYVAQDNSWMLAATYVAATGSLMVSYTRARAEALAHSAKVGILSRVERYVVLTLALLIDMPAIALVVIAAFTYMTVAQRVVHVWQQARVS